MISKCYSKNRFLSKLHNFVAGDYHVILIPSDPTKTRRFRFSSWTTRLLGLGSALAIPIILGSLFIAIHYQNEVVALRQQMAEEHQILEQKEVLSNRMAQLERNVSRVENDVSRLSQATNANTGQVIAGLGPVQIETVLEKIKSHKVFSDLLMDRYLENDGLLSIGEIHGQMNGVGDRIRNTSARLDDILESNEDKIRFMDAYPTGSPVAGWMTSSFGYRQDPYSHSFGMHYGIDIAAPMGSAVRAPANAKVLFADYRSGYGRNVVLDHGYGLVTLYGHASQLFVKEGDVIKRGQVIAAVGSTGASTGPHLHYEVHVDGIPMDPLTYLK